MTSGRSAAAAESDKHSVPLSAAALPTDWGDWDSERPPSSTQCLGTCSDSLKTDLAVTVRICLRYRWSVFLWTALFVPFREIPGDNVRFEYIQVIQVNIFRSLMLAPLSHSFMRKKKRYDCSLFSYFLLFLNAKQTKRIESEAVFKPHPPSTHSALVHLHVNVSVLVVTSYLELLKKLQTSDKHATSLGAGGVRGSWISRWRASLGAASVGSRAALPFAGWQWSPPCLPCAIRTEFSVYRTGLRGKAAGSQVWQLGLVVGVDCITRWRHTWGQFMVAMIKTDGSRFGLYNAAYGTYFTALFLCLCV